jgi:hypothetical protein
MTARNGLVPTAAVLSQYMMAFAVSAVGTKDRYNEKSRSGKLQFIGEVESKKAGTRRPRWATASPRIMELS